VAASDIWSLRQNYGGSGKPCRKDFFHRNVKADRGKLQHRSLALDSVKIIRRDSVVHQSAMRQQHAARFSGRARR